MSAKLANPNVPGWGWKPRVSRRQPQRCGFIQRAAVARLVSEPVLLNVPKAALVRDVRQVFGLSRAGAYEVVEMAVSALLRAREGVVVHKGAL
jgi:hypothetical protein